MNNFYNNQWGIKILKSRKILIFGAKAYAEEIYKNWREKSKICGFIVSKRRDNPYVIADKPVYIFEDILLEERSSYVIVISQKYDSIDAMKKILKEAGFRNCIAWRQFTSYESYQNKDNLWCKKINKLPESKNSIDKELIKKLRIYAVTSHRNLHKEKFKISSNFVELIQGGAALTNVKISEIRDDSGKNVSNENPQLCEMSAAYWIGNNDKEHSYVGLCHYCRLFDISDKQVMAIFEEDYDMVLTSPLISYEQIITRTDPHMYKAIERVFPESVPFAEKYLLDHVFFQGNLMIAKRHIYKEYIDWVFQVLDAMKDVFGEEGIEMYPRCLAYAAEHLTNIFVLKNYESLKIGYVNALIHI